MATVLIVDDHATNREVARATLDLGGHHVIEATEGQQALAMARAVHPDVILTDVVMPGMDGYELAHALRTDAGTADIPVLFYTANYSPAEAQPIATAYGVAQVLAKSADPLELLTAVEQALHHDPAPLKTDDGLTTGHLRTVNAKLIEKILALDESEARFEAFAELAPVGIAFGGSDLHATYVNTRLSEITATATADLLGPGWLRCLAPAGQSELRNSDTLLAGTATYAGPVILSPGMQRHLQVVVRPLNDHGDPGGFIAVITDVTPLIEAERRRHAEERDREIEERRQIAQRFDSLARLSGAVAHDFNNMLGVILSFGEFVEEAVVDTVDQPLTAAKVETILHDLDQVTRAGKRAAHLAHQLLTFGGKEVMQPTVINLNAIVEEVCGMLATAVGGQITVTTRLDPHLRNTRTDASQLCQVLFNLAINARDAMPRGGALVFRSTNKTDADTGPRAGGAPGGEYVHIAVTDNGDGMPPEVIDRAMEPFFTTKAKGQGTGLGLATAYGVIKQAGGDLIIDSAVGRGTTIHLYLPATDEPTHTSQPAATAQTPAGHTILLAEDEDGLRHAAVRILTNAGYHVLNAANGQDALTLARQHNGPIHGLLTDVVMPHMNGPTLAAALSIERPGTPVLYMSGYAAPLMTEQGLLEPDVTVLGKPFTKDELLTALNTALTDTTQRQLTTVQ
ncbi:MAG TPA: response regulator [Micromonosporaceae bacterium]|nr:response regulator [Micromonosporaceae bacterium]